LGGCRDLGATISSVAEDSMSGESEAGEVESGKR
jgi:hypothetical protein